MKITQEQLDKGAQAIRAQSLGENVNNYPWEGSDEGIKGSYRQQYLAALEAHFSEPIEVEEPEPEIPDTVIEAAQTEFHKNLYPFAFPCDGTHQNCKQLAKAVLLAAYKAGWGGMRK